jgi:hypothetical protein
MNAAFSEPMAQTMQCRIVAQTPDYDMQKARRDGEPFDDFQAARMLIFAASRQAI